MAFVIVLFNSGISIGFPICSSIPASRHAFEEDRKACLEAGMNEHIGKPIDIPQLKRAITKLLTKRGSKRKNIIIH